MNKHVRTAPILVLDWFEIHTGHEMAPASPLHGLKGEEKEQFKLSLIG